MAQEEKFSITVDYIQSTGGKADHENLDKEYSSDKSIHMIKCEVYTRHLTQAMANIATELTQMGLSQENGGKPGK